MTNEQGLAGISAIIAVLLEETYVRGVRTGYGFAQAERQARRPRKSQKIAEGATSGKTAPSSEE